jgi:hypothetical protein
MDRPTRATKEEIIGLCASAPEQVDLLQTRARGLERRLGLTEQQPWQATVQ